MGSQGKIFIAAISVLVVANYSKVVESTFGTVKRSVGTVELARIDKALWQFHLMEEIGASGAKRYHFPEDQGHFEKVLQESFDTPGRDPTKDQWGMTLQYKPSADKNGYALLSFGPDREGATDDDLWLERRERNVTMSCGLEKIETDSTAQMDAVTKAKEELAGELQKAAEEIEVEEANESTADVAAGTAAAADPGETHWSDEVEAAAKSAAVKVEATVSSVVAKTQSLIAPEEPPPSGDPPPASNDTAPPASPPEAPTAVKAASASPRPSPQPPRLRKLSTRQDRQARRLLVSAKNLAINELDGKARRYYQRLIDDFPGSSYAQQAELALAELAE